MAVREALLTLLVVGENYGFRLHNELTRRVPSRASLNVGQTYATLERAGIAGLITDAGMNAEGLPQYRLTDAGLKVVNEWLLGADAPATRPDDETIERLFLVMSLPNWDSYSSVSRTAVLDSEQSRWTKRASEALGVSALDTEWQALKQAQARTTLDWIEKFAAAGPREVVFSEPSKRGRPAGQRSVSESE